ncbi:cysteine protease StiP family protein [Acetitomaculum ruminis]|uniref:cysteine protease StiP family protein n=1 Tax=Acetitomaculum ruminis TaxID=2382 RepID=UPI000B8056B4
MKSTYKKEDVTLLLKDVTGKVKPLDTASREQFIQSGRHYCEMLPIEYVPTAEYMEAYREALLKYGKSVADATGVLSKKIIENKGKKVVLVSLARAGIPAGILLKHYIQKKYGVDVPHYGISIIRGRGIDKNAINYILKNHDVKDLLFVDGWTGKGAILTELKKAVADFKGLSGELAVLADPAGITKMCGTYEDLLIPSSCLNSTVSGLISRTFLRDDIIKKDDYHGAVFYGELKEKDLSYDFINAIESHFDFNVVLKEEEFAFNDTGKDEVAEIAAHFEISDINLVKPGIGEATRVLLRRVPWKVLVKEGSEKDDKIAHLLKLAKEKDVEVISYPLRHYIACGLIRQLSDI